jgi:hypothetical protein
MITIVSMLIFQSRPVLISFSHTILHWLPLPLGMTKDRRSRHRRGSCPFFRGIYRVINLPSFVPYRPIRIQRR